jgi:hypothetical protein
LALTAQILIHKLVNTTSGRRLLIDILEFNANKTEISAEHGA